MIKKLTFNYLLWGMLILFSNPLFSLEKNDKTVKVPNDVLETTKNINAFALQMYKLLPSSDNLSFSPYSISSAFAMAYAGAKGDTQKEIASVFHYPESTKINGSLAWLNRFLTIYPSNATEDIRMKIGNSLWIQTHFPVLASFQKNMSNYFNGSFRYVDFKQKETARSIINAWVKENTMGKISDILTSESLDSSTRMVLISALYLKAKWKNQFDAKLTNQQPFFSEDGSTQTTLSMNQAAIFPYLDTEEVSILEMPYISSRREGPQFSMLILLPHQRDGLSNIEKDLTIEKLEQWNKNLENTHVTVTIPKIKTTQSYNLNELLTKMGMDLPFSNNADFSGISDVKGLKIGNVLHKAYLSVDETGSEAAAATAISINKTTVIEQKPAVIFQADHPFLYVIFEKSTGIILFMGRFANP